jgi:nicotinamide phosphoribosyltransferase
MGGALLQQVDRDTQKFAMKASSVCINGQWISIAKDPVTDPGKKSKAGRVTLWKSGSELISSVEQPHGWHDHSVGEFHEVLETVFENGVLVKEINFDQVRANSRA